MSSSTGSVQSSRPSRHSLITRGVHALLAASVVYQLATSLFMDGVVQGRPDDLLFRLHQYAGPASLLIVLAFWIVVLTRRRGTGFGALIPWLSASRRALLFDDLRVYRDRLRQRSMPEFRDDSPLASAIHGLGLCLMTAMGATGTIWLVADLMGYRASLPAELVIEVHKILSNLAWAYLGGHAGMALLHHFRREASINTMWSLRSDEGTEE